MRSLAAGIKEWRMPASVKRTPAIMLVEDELDILMLLHRLMRNLTAGYDIVTVNSGAEALVQIALRPVPLLITDNNMPSLNGIALTRAVKAAYPTTRVALMTASATPDLERRAQAAGVDYYLPRPFPLDRLETIVREVCGVDDGHGVSLTPTGRSMLNGGADTIG
jgi:two-component system, response regulator, stage 0 sporulation protein F